jgi:uncharacterized protein YbaP (TraB family)
MLAKLLITGLLLWALPVFGAGERLLFWEVTTEHAKVYLLGSMHLARPDIYPLREGIEQAFAESDALVVEIDIGGAARLAVQERMLQRGTYPEGETLRDHLSASTWRDLERQIQASGLPPEAMERLKPGLVLTTLTTLEMMKLGLTAEHGIDRHFLELARGHKPIIELETIDRQLDVLLNFPDPDLLVRQSLSQMAQIGQIMDQLVSSWKRGDADALRRLVIDDELAAHPEFGPIHRRLFDDRNREMVERVAALQAQGGRYFVVVGAGHLVGEQGIISLLSRRGQQPRQL